MPRSCIVDRHGAVTVVTLDRPERLNALDMEAHFELDEIFQHFEADATQSVAIITGAGDRAFCAGHDLRDPAGGVGARFPAGGFGGLTTRDTMTKPVIAAVNGIAFGGGFELALACDMVVAASSARFALPEPRVGLAALGGGLQRLPREIGLKRAMSIILTGRHVEASEGLQLGFVNEVVEPSQTLSTALGVAALILDCSPLAIRASKQIARASVDPEFTMTSAFAFPAVQALMRSRDVIEGPLAFAERRKPRWTEC